jgi:hypothetical protein
MILGDDDVGPTGPQGTHERRRYIVSRLIHDVGVRDVRVMARNLAIGAIGVALLVGAGALWRRLVPTPGGMERPIVALVGVILVLWGAWWAWRQRDEWHRLR